MNILNWNARGINSPRKSKILHDMIKENNVDMIAIQETKKEYFSNRILKTLSPRLDIWHWVPSIGRSGGILFGCDSSKLKLLSYSAHKFALDIRVECKTDAQVWQQWYMDLLTEL